VVDASKSALSRNMDIMTRKERLLNANNTNSWLFMRTINHSSCWLVCNYNLAAKAS
jgi:hypothetical protein